MRYLPLNEADRAAMREVVGVSAVDELFSDVPADALNPKLDLPPHQGELSVERQMRALASKNLAAGDAPFFAGCGAYKHHVPATVDHIIQRSEFLTAYTPYQPEIAQGTLQYLFEFQTQVATLTGMEVANASMYDGSTACAEAALMARRVTGRKKVVCSGGLHPHYAAVIHTNSELIGDTVLEAPSSADGHGSIADMIDDETSCIVVQSPDVFGHVRDLSALAEKAHEHGALLVAVVTEAVSFGLLKSPGAQGADIVVAEGQSIGNALNFGGPYVGLFAARQKHIRHMPGRLCGETVDADGQRGFVLTLSTREQHIRRDKATSNICTNSGLCSLAFTVHMSLLGGQGLRRLAILNHETACRTADALSAVPGVEILNERFFNEFTVRLPKDAAEVVEALAERGIVAGVPGGRLWPNDPEMANLLIVAATEVTTDEDVRALAEGLKAVL
ncbi:aminomethyl-transferring glycine dehydrogenase subunit GcvPA [Parvularcula dongshanensis]|uniref:Probable glycine dehydrogenase (decarboxylating) subunit 1 n=1 Tax=Parvularcula dongshanensis TaxID=1173995 RepID=A0A840I2I8_9PROT|nr:aminomethyl-transferring glycine dehydrogenase subunit GcvPA [Parvularcula dongshanensis]MBB4658512.1 glycine dehydrogenase subunit 1 [Parvularcula dongshanensis]